jgi:hypothetical protein
MLRKAFLLVFLPSLRCARPLPIQKSAFKLWIRLRPSFRDLS